MDPVSNRHEVVLLKNRLITRTIECHGAEHQHDIDLYVANGKNIFCSEESKANDDHVNFFFELLEDIPVQPLFDNIIVTLCICKNEETGKFGISAEVSLPTFFVESLSKVLIEPELSVEGQFSLRTSSTYSEWKNFKLSVSFGRQLFPRFEGSHDLSVLINQAKTIDEQTLSLHYNVTVTWKRFGTRSRSNQDNLSVMEKLLLQKPLADCILIASNLEEVSCHRNVIAAQSDVLHTMLTSGLEESQTNRINMPDVSEEGLKTLVSYFYLNKIETEEIGDELVLELFQTAHQYNISNLEGILADLISNKPGNWFSPRVVLNLYLFTSKVEEFKILKKKMVRIIKSNVTQFRSSQPFQEFLENYPKEAADLNLLLIK